MSCEKSKGADGKMYVVIGIGVNLFFDRGEAPSYLREIAGSVFDVSGVEYHAPTLCAEIVNELEKLLSDENDSEKVLNEYRSRSIVLGQEISVIQGDEEKRAAALDICEDGSLLVRYENGFTSKLCGGEISIRRSW